jgi:hypothetical protein
MTSRQSPPDDGCRASLDLYHPQWPPWSLLAGPLAPVESEAGLEGWNPEVLLLITEIAMRTRSWIGGGMLALSVGLACNALLGPFALDVIRYHFGASMTNQGIGLDTVTLLLVAPMAAIAGILTLRGRRAGRVLGLGPAAFAVYMVPQYVIGPVYDRLPGNNERFLLFHLALFVLGVAVFVAAWAAIVGRLPPESRLADRRRMWVMAGVAGFIVLRWSPVVVALASESDAGAAYRDNPTAQVLIALLDLGLVVPAALAVAVGLWRGASWARKGAYAVIGWFALVPVSVAAMAITMQVRGDPDGSLASSVSLSVVALVFLVAAAALYLPLLAEANEPDAGAENTWPCTAPATDSMATSAGASRPSGAVAPGQAAVRR